MEILLGFESGAGYSLDDSNDSRMKENSSNFFLRFFTISPIRAGYIKYVMYYAYHMIHAQRIIQSTQQVISSPEYSPYLWEQINRSATFNPGTCSKSNWYEEDVMGSFTNYLYSGGWTPIHLYAVAIPYEWSDKGLDPQPLIGSIGPWFVVRNGKPLAGVLGPWPNLEVIRGLAPESLAKPGQEISASSILKTPSGGTFKTSIREAWQPEKTHGSGTVVLNPNESSKVSASGKLPGLNPGEKWRIEELYSMEFCDFSKQVQHQDARSLIISQLGAGPSKSFVSEILPTDAVLHDTKGRRIQLVGTGFSYEGIIVSKSGENPRLSGQPPWEFSYEEGDLIYLNLTFDKEVAVCEDRKIVSEGIKTYTWSVAPLPQVGAMRARGILSSLLPPAPGKGLPIPSRLQSSFRVSNEVLPEGS